MPALKQSFNTTEIFQHLAESFFGEKKELDDVIRQATYTYIKFGQQNEAWKDLQAASKSVEIPVRDLIDKLSTATTPLAKAAFGTLSAEAEPILQRSNEAEIAADAVYLARNSKRDEALDALKSVWKAKNSGSQDKKNQLEKAKAICDSSAAELKKQTVARVTVNLELDDLAWRIYQAQERKSDIPRSSFTPSMVHRLGSSSST